MRDLYVPVIACLFLHSCNDHKDIGTKRTIQNELQKSRMMLFHEDSSVHNKRGVLFLESFAKNLGLPVLTSGHEGLYIRIWCWDSGENEYVIDIRKTSAVNECSVISFVGKYIDSVAYLIVHDRKNVSPNSGWDLFFTTLERYKIPVRDAVKLSKQQFGRYTGGEYIQFEIAQPGQYRFYEYYDPFFYKDENEQSKEVYDFLKYFNEEMGTHVYEVEKQSK